jgi:hypothetical protein
MNKLNAFMAKSARRSNQRGMASIVIVAVLVVILTLVSIGFGRLMNRAITNSTDKELSAAASYAAQSGVGDAIKYIQANYDPANPDISVKKTTCTQLFTDSSSLLFNKQSLSGADNNVRYTCLTIDPDVKDLVFGSLPAYKSQVIKMTTSPAGALSGGSLMFSWKDSSGLNTSTVAGNSFYDETYWASHNYAPVLRVTLYPLASSATVIDNAALQSASRTYFFYPNTGVAGQPITPVTYNGASTPQGVGCGNTTDAGFNTGSDNPGDYTCSVIITNLPAAGLFYARVTPLYDSSNLRVQGNDSTGNLVLFQGVQAVVDSTAKASTSSKRLQARVDLGGANGSISDNISPGDNAIPEFAHDSPNALCKQLDVNSVTVLNLAPSGCGPTITQPVLGIGLCVTNGGSSCTPPTPTSVTISDNATATLEWTVVNSLPGSCSLSPGGPSGFGDGTNVQYTTGPLANSGSPSYTFTLKCTDFSGATSSQSVTVNVNPPPVPVPPAPPPLPPPGPPPCDPATDPACAPPEPPVGVPCVLANPPGDPRPECDYLRVGFYSVSYNTNPPAADICGDTVHTLVACVYWTWFYNRATSSIACWVWWYPDGSSPIMESGNLRTNLSPSGAASGFVFGISDVATAPSLTGYAVITCQSNQNPLVPPASASARIDFTGICGYDPSFDLTACTSAVPPPSPPPIGPPPPPPLPPPPICGPRVRPPCVE